MERDPGSNPRKRDRRRSRAQTSDTDLLLSLVHLTDRVADLFLLIMVRVIALFATQNHLHNPPCSCFLIPGIPARYDLNEIVMDP
jgi:hypothetical protein